MCSTTGSIVKMVGHNISVFRMRCKSWQCDECAPLRRRALIREAKEGSPNRFITLTVNPAWFDSPDERASKLAAAWRGVVAAFKHRWPGRPVEYMCIFEATKMGEPHLHIIWRGAFMPQKWLSAQMRKRMGAPIVDVRRVRGQHQVANYVTKYISKRPIRFGTCKRYWRSGGYLSKSPRQARRERNAGATFWRSRRHVCQHAEEALVAKLSIVLWGVEKLEYEIPEHWTHPPGMWLEEGFYIPPVTPKAA